MKKYDVIFFDLDGTIVDSAPGILESVKYALNFFGIKEENEEKLNLFIGPPLFDAFSEHYNMNREDADLAVAKYRENYNENKAVLKYSVYEEIEEVLRELKKAGKTICLATAKPLKFAEIILKEAGLYNYFDIVNGASFDESKRTKTAVIKDTIESNNFKKDKILMVGDRENDVTGAKNNNIDVLGVLYGYGDEKELKDAGCENIVNKPKDILNFILN